tara:strand:+ start:2480 stop:2752 length:273 start_codon:yes stop_codon:yes gene_type:complete
MLNKTITKLWQGHLISIRDYDVVKGINQGGIVVHHNGDTMTLSVEALKHGRQLTKNIKSKFPNSKSYGLVDFEWKPKDKRQPLFNILKEA